MKRERIVIISHSARDFGAHTRQKELASLAAKKGHAVFWLGVQEAKDEISDLDGVHFLAMPKSGLHIPFLSVFFAAFLGLLIHRKHMKNAYLVPFSEYDALACLLLRFLLRPSRIVFAQRADMISKSEYLKSLLGARREYFRVIFQKIVYSYILKKLNRVIVQTPVHLNNLASRNLDVKNVVIVPNNSNASWMPKQSSKADAYYLSLSSPIKFLVIANLYYEVKGFDFLFDLLEEINGQSSLIVDVIGRGPERELLAAEIYRRGLNHFVKLKGSVDNASALIQDYDAILIPSPYDDCPNVLLEALRSKICIFATDIPAHRFLVGEKFPLLPRERKLWVTEINEFIRGVPVCRSKYFPGQRYEFFVFDWSALMLENILRS